MNRAQQKSSYKYILILITKRAKIVNFFDEVEIERKASQQAIHFSAIMIYGRCCSRRDASAAAASIERIRKENAIIKQERKCRHSSSKEAQKLM